MHTHDLPTPRVVRLCTRSRAYEIVRLGLHADLFVGLLPGQVLLGAEVGLTDGERRQLAPREKMTVVTGRSVECAESVEEILLHHAAEFPRAPAHMLELQQRWAGLRHRLC